MPDNEETRPFLVTHHFDWMTLDTSPRADIPKERKPKKASVRTGAEFANENKTMESEYKTTMPVVVNRVPKRSQRIPNTGFGCEVNYARTDGEECTHQGSNGEAKGNRRLWDG